MRALEELGLDRTADERAVKRAYAGRLRTTRPDEDPQGFQKLHEAYAEALAFVRWRADNPDATYWDDEQDQEDAHPEPEDEAAPPDGALRVVAPAAAFDALLQPAPEPEPQVDPFRIDVDAFVPALFDQAADGDGDALRRWLARESLAWPISAKPFVARCVLEHMLENDVDLAPGPLGVIFETFGFDDVMTGFNPLMLAQLRERIEIRYSRRERAERFERLLRPGARGELSHYMRGRYGALTTRAIAHILTSPHAYDWAYALRPLPWVTTTVMGFLRHLDKGRFDALSPAIADTTISFWEWAEARRERNKLARYLVIFAAMVCALFFANEPAQRTPLSNQTEDGRPPAWRQPQHDRLAWQTERVARQMTEQAEAYMNDGRNVEALDIYKKIIAQIRQPWTPMTERYVTVAYYNTAYFSKATNNLPDARQYYRDLEQTFSPSTSGGVDHWVASGMVNLAQIHFEAGEYDEATAVYDRVIARYDRRSYLRPSVWGAQPDWVERQVAKSILGKAEILAKRGRREEATALCDNVLRRHGQSTNEQMQEIIATARKLKSLIEQPL